MVYNQLLVSFKSKVKFLHKITIHGVLILCGTKSARISDTPSICPRHTASQILVLLPQVELGKPPKVKRLLIDLHSENKMVCPLASAD